MKKTIGEINKKEVHFIIDNDDAVYSEDKENSFNRNIVVYDGCKIKHLGKNIYFIEYFEPLLSKDISFIIFPNDIKRVVFKLID